MKVSRLSIATSELHASILGTSAARPAFNAIVGPIVPTIQGGLTAEHMGRLFEETFKTSIGDVLGGGMHLPAPVRFTLTVKGTHLLLAAALGPFGGDFDPSRVVALVRESIDAAKENQDFMSVLKKLQDEASQFGVLMID